MSTIEIRSTALAEKTEVRSVPIADVDEDSRTITGIAVPYGQVTTRIGYPEEFAPGAFPDGATATLHTNHGGQSGELPIGTVVGRNTDAGYRVTATIARTARGDEALQLVREGVLKHFSVGFRPLSHEMRGDTVVRTRAELAEVSIVERPAYTGAVIDQLRTASTDPDPVAELRAEYENKVGELERRIALVGDQAGRTVGRTFQCRSGGEFLKALATGNKAIIDEYRAAAEDLETRAFTGATTEDTVMRPAWIDKILRLTDRKRPLTNLFRSEPLPAAGNTYEYPYVASETGTVTEQVNEGDDLAFLKIALDTDSAAIRTVGGYTSLSRQTIERATVAWLDTALRWLAIQYAESFELMVRLFFEGLPVDNVTARLNVNEIDVTTKPTTADGWIGAAFDAAAAIEDNSKGLLADFIVVDRTIAKEIVMLKDTTGRPIFGVNGDGANTWGDMRIQAQDLVGSINSLPVVVVPRLSAPTFTVCSRDALTTMESAGAPVRLEDENIINLTKDFSLYGYQSIYSEERKGISKVTWA
ncbi:phage major capsid protein [Rhodococcus ruber]|uniref:phage major capsid protein n=1 Tax=Rhodococcus ruber TaxID=1830 RepID=UPI003D812A09